MKSSGVVSKVLAVVGLLQVAAAWRPFNDLRVKTAAYGLNKDDAYFEIPTNTSSPLFQDYVRAEPEEDFPFPLDFYCHRNDPIVCFMYDKKGNVAGVQISFLKEELAHIKKEDYDYESNINYVKTNFFNKAAYSSRVYFTNPEKLTVEGRNNKDEFANGLWSYLKEKLPIEEVRTNKEHAINLWSYLKDNLPTEEGRTNKEYANNLWSYLKEKLPIEEVRINKDEFANGLWSYLKENMPKEGRYHKGEFADGLWTYLEGKLVEIQREEPTGPKMGDFDRQGCYPGMGQHYFYNYNKNTDCKKVYALFPLYEQGGLVGFGIGVPGSGFKKHLKDWYEKPNEEVGKFVVPNPLSCTFQKYGFTTVHVYMVDKPWDIKCQ